MKQSDHSEGRAGSGTSAAVAEAATGARTSIDARAFVAPGATLGRNCVVKSGAYICRSAILEDEVSVEHNVVLVDAPLSSTKIETLIGNQVSVGANSTIYPGVTVGSKALIRPGSVVTRSVPRGAIVEGNPACIVGYVGTSPGNAASLETPQASLHSSVEPTSVRGVALHHFPLIPDMRGSLTVCEFEKQMPFMPKRSFLVFDVPSREVRGEHAHRECHELLICARGSLAVVTDDGTNKAEFLLDSPTLGIYLPPMVWRVHYKYSADAILLVFASHCYDSSDYIRDYAEFLRCVGTATQFTPC